MNSMIAMILQIVNSISIVALAYCVYKLNQQKRDQYNAIRELFEHVVQIKNYINRKVQKDNNGETPIPIHSIDDID